MQPVPCNECGSPIRLKAQPTEGYTCWDVWRKSTIYLCVGCYKKAADRQSFRAAKCEIGGA